MDFSLPFPLLTGDYALYYARALRTVAFEAASGRFWGYNPFAMAGYVSGAVHGLGSHLFSLVASALYPLVPVHRALMTVEVACLLLMPLAVYGFVRCVADRWSAVAALGATTVIYGRFGFASPQPFLHGFLPFQVGCFLAFLCGGLYLRWIRSGSRSAFAGFTALLAVIPTLHPGTAPILALVLVPAALGTARFMSRTRAQLALGAVAAALLLNIPWIRTLMGFRDWIVGVPYYPEMSPLLLWRLIEPFQFGWLGAVSAIANVAMFGFAVVGFMRIRSEDRGTALAVAVWLAGLTVFSIAGSHVGLGTAGPGRYAIALEILLLSLAGIGLAEVAQTNPKAVLFVAIFGVAAAATSDAADVRSGERRLDNKLFPIQAAVEAFVRTDDRGGRTLIETEIGNAPHYLDLLPSLTGAQILGGSNAGNFLKSRFTVFSGDFKPSEGTRAYRPSVFGLPLIEQSPERFASYLRLYNVRTILAWSREAQVELDRFGSILTRGGVTGNHRIYRVASPGGPLLEGSGAVEPRFDGLVIDGASAGRLVLGYHWIKTLEVRPPLPMRPRFYLDDPVPFIEIDNAQGASRIEIRNAGL